MEHLDLEFIDQLLCLGLRSVGVKFSLHNDLYIYFCTMHDDFGFIWIYDSLLYMYHMLTILIFENKMLNVLELRKKYNMKSLNGLLIV